MVILSVNHWLAQRENKDRERCIDRSSSVYLNSNKNNYVQAPRSRHVKSPALTLSRPPMLEDGNCSVRVHICYSVLFFM
jgi:hypothetical protein